MIWILLAAGVMACDLLVKAYVRKHAEELRDREIAGGRAKIRLLYNKGFAGSRLEEKQMLVRCVTCASALLFLTYFLCSLQTKGEHALKACMALVMGGAAGNTAERLVRGKVTDYIAPVRKGKNGKYVYNLADIFIVIGTAGAAVSMIAGLFRTK